MELEAFFNRAFRKPMTGSIPTKAIQYRSHQTQLVQTDSPEQQHADPSAAEPEAGPADPSKRKS